MHFPFSYKTKQYKRIIHKISTITREEVYNIKETIKNTTTTINLEQIKPFPIKLLIRLIEKPNDTIIHIKTEEMIEIKSEIKEKYFSVSLENPSKIITLIKNKKYLSIIDAVLKDLDILLIQKIENLQVFTPENFKFIKNDTIHIQTNINDETKDFSVYFTLTKDGVLKAKTFQDEIREFYKSPHGTIYSIPVWKPVETTHLNLKEDYKKLKESIENKNTFLLNSIVKEWFDNYINHQLEDPFIDDDYLNGNRQESYWQKGSQEDLMSLIKSIVYSYKYINKIDTWPLEILISSQTEYSKQDISIFNNDSMNKSEKIQKLLCKATEDNICIGWNFEYNDGYTDRLSGYSKYPETLYLEIDKPSPHDILDAKINIKKWIKQKFKEE